MTMSAASRLVKISPFAQESREPLAEEFEGSKAAIALAGIGIWQLLMPSGEWICDQTCAGLLDHGAGMSPSSLLDLEQCLHPDDSGELRLRIELCARTGATVDRQFRFRGATEETRWLQMTATRSQRSEAGSVLVGTLRDITEQRSITDALRTSEARLDTIFSQAMVGILHRDRDLNVLMVNDRYLELVGRTAEELSGLPVDEFTHPDDATWNLPLLAEQQARGEPFTIEKRYLRPDGSAIWCEVNVSFVADPAGGWKSIIVFAHEITDRKLAQEEKQQTNEMLALALDGAGAGLWEIDLANACIDMSPAARGMYGLPEGHSGTLPLAEWAEFIAPDSLASVKEEFETFLRSEGPRLAEFKVRTAGGEERWLRVHGRAVIDNGSIASRIVGLVYDDTERKQAEETLRRHEARNSLIQEAALIGTFESTPDGTTIGSRQFYRNLGLPDDTNSIDRQTRLALLHPDDRPKFLAEFDRILDEGQAVHELEYRVIRANDGEERWMLARFMPERDQDGALVSIIGAHLDITDAKHATASLRESESLNKGIVEASTDCIKILDLDGTLRFMSDKGMKALEIESETQILGQNWASLWPEEARAQVEVVLALARAGKIGRFNAGCPTAKGKWKWWDVIVTPLVDDQGKATQILSISRDVSELREHAERIREVANRDALTGIANRNYFQDQLGGLLCVAETSGEQVGLLVLDVDNFKRVNDTLGHDAGDALLKVIATRLDTSIENGDFVARLGGDEFAIVVRHVEHGRDLLDVARTINESLKKPCIHRGCLLDCRVSIGGAIFPDHGGDPDELFKNADTALYAAKSGGRDQALCFHPSMRSELDRRINMIDMARSALHRNELVPFYQPKISLRTGKIEGFEALLRWRDPTGTIRLPGEIEAAFEDLELAQAISDRMQDQVIEDMRIWLATGIEFGHVALNAAAAEFRMDDFAERLLKKLDAADIPAHHLELEVTETVFLGRGAEYVGKALEKLSAAGIRVALDDFGTGYASLSHLKTFPVDTIKIDQSFVSELGTDEGDTAIVLALLQLASSLQIGIVAEGIETQEQADFLAGHGCDFGQGFLYGRAVDPRSVEVLLSLQNCPV